MPLLAFTWVGVARAEETDAVGCLPKATLPVATCVKPMTAAEAATLALQGAAQLTKVEDFEGAVDALRDALPRADASGDYGLWVRVRAAFGQALLADESELGGLLQLRVAIRAWQDPAALGWIRSLPDGEASRVAIERASDAVAEATFTLAEFSYLEGMKALPRFELADEDVPFAPRSDAELTPAQAKVRNAWRQRYRHALAHYVETVVTPWADERRRSLQRAEREYEKVYWVAPQVSPRWRIAVNAGIGEMWWDFVRTLRRLDGKMATVAAFEGVRTSYSCLDEVGESEKKLARAAFENCVALSRKHHVISEDTLECEAWLGTQYRSEHTRVDDLFPSADMLPRKTWLDAARPVALPAAPRERAELGASSISR